MEQRNVIWAVVLSLLVIIGFQYLAPPAPQPTKQAQPGPNQQQAETIAPVFLYKNREEALAKTGTRIPVASPKLTGSISLTGARFDDLTLVNYRETVDPKSSSIHLLQPVGLKDSYFVEFGWVSTDKTIIVPKSDTVWQTTDQRLETGKPLRLTWENGQGVEFQLIFSIDENYLLKVDQQVANRSNQSLTLFPYSRIVRSGTPTIGGFFILHEGLIGVANDELKEIDYSDIQETRQQVFNTKGGWAGITDKYWLVALIPNQQEQVKSSYSFFASKPGQPEMYQVDYLLPAVNIEAISGKANSQLHLVAGAKEVALLDKYAESLSIPLFDRAVDFGWFYFLTRPIFLLLKMIYDWIGNFGIAILLLTVFIKLLLYPLANKSYRSMARLKEVAPEMSKIRERYGQDRQKMNQEMIALYRREKLNPAAGCLPILIQIPVFFALYKVLFVTIEMRHAPFFAWIQDLSAPDPTSILNLFGLLPWVVPPDSFLAFMNIGIWPILMGITMYIQQRLNPTPPDPIQAKIFKFLPIIFTFMLAHFSAGLVIYWTWNNLLSIIQQRLIMHSVAKKPVRKASKPAS